MPNMIRLKNYIRILKKLALISKDDIPSIIRQELTMRKIISVISIIITLAALMACSTGPAKKPAEAVPEEPEWVPVGPQRPRIENPHNYFETAVAKSLPFPPKYVE